MTMLSTTVMLAASLSLFAAGQDPQPEVTIYRSWRAPDVTVVEGMFRVDPQLLGTTDCVYGVQLTVRDAQGTELQREQWDGQCPQEQGAVAAALETFQFGMPNTTYMVEVQVFPRAQPERRRTRRLQVSGLAAQPHVSDLILARDIGYVDSANARTWTMQKGTVGLRTSSQVIVMPDDPSLSYYIELYADSARPMMGAVTGIIKRADGKELTRTKLQELDALSQPQPVAGSFPVAGLPPGAYSFEAQVQLRDTLIVRAHPFYVGATPVAAGVTVSGQGWFYTLSDERLAELFDPAVVWLTEAEAATFVTLPPAGKREFLSRQFGREGPTPDDDSESALDAYLARVEKVNALYGERAGRGEQAPWRTPRGQIYLIRGEPSSRITRPSPQSGAPYEIWHYGGQQAFVYVFADDTRMGHYRLVYTNDANEQGVPDWTRRLGAQALDHLSRLGFRPRVDGP